MICAVSFPEWFSANWYLPVIFAVSVVVVFLLLRLQVAMRNQSEKTIEALLRTDPGLCAERLENNRRLGWLFRKPVLELWKLDAYMALGQDDKAKKAISNLDGMRLEPRDTLEFYQKRLSFFATTGNREEAYESRTQLTAFLKKNKLDKEKQFANVLDEADIIIGVYIDRNTGLIKKLVGRAEHTKNDVMRGITQYRIAKLAWFKGDGQMMKTYLTRAAKNLKGTYYEPVIEQAQTDPAILEYK